MKAAYIIFGIVLFASLSKESETETRSIYDDNQKAEEQSEVMQILQTIMRDPEFLSLNPKQQLEVLIALYNMLRNYFDNRKLGVQKRKTASLI
jgi:hypothetical protein